jgi:hypothetical protein
MLEQQKTKNPFETYNKDYEKILRDIAQEEKHLRKELQKEEERIRQAIKDNFKQIKETFGHNFEPSLTGNQNGEISINLQHSFSIKFFFEVEQKDNKFNIKLSTRGEVGNYNYRRFAVPPQSTVTDYNGFIEQQFNSFLTQFNKFISNFERENMLERLRQEVKKP